jgi:hypothetical protein
MTNTLIKLAAIACLISPLGAAAGPMTTYKGTSASDTYTFSLDQTSTVSIGYSWSDMLLVKEGSHRYYDALLSWTLNGPISLSGTLDDTNAVNEVTQGVLSLGDLTAGTYTLSLSGIWDSVTLFGNGNNGFVKTDGTVDLIDGDQDGSNSFSAIPVVLASSAAPTSNIPEPTTSAIALLGLGVMVAIRRRSSKKALNP